MLFLACSAQSLRESESNNWASSTVCLHGIHLELDCLLIPSLSGQSVVDCMKDDAGLRDEG